MIKTLFRLEEREVGLIAGLWKSGREREPVPKPTLTYNMTRVKINSIVTVMSQQQ